MKHALQFDHVSNSRDLPRDRAMSMRGCRSLLPLCILLLLAASGPPRPSASLSLPLQPGPILVGVAVFSFHAWRPNFCVLRRESIPRVSRKFESNFFSSFHRSRFCFVRFSGLARLRVLVLFSCFGGSLWELLVD